MRTFVSVVIPAYNSEKVISRVIEALLHQSYPKNKYEIIVVDDGSTDRTAEVASRFPIRVLRLKHAGPANARNTGAKKAKGDILLFTDADCVPDKNWIKAMIEPFKDPEIVAVSGTYKTLNKEKFMARFVGYEIDQRHEKMKKQKYIDFIGTFSAAYRKKIFLKFGGFDSRFKTSSGEDPEISYRMAKAGLKMVFQSAAFVYHPHPDTLWNYSKQKYQRAVWRNMMYWGGHKDKLAGDSYTHKMIFPQALLSGLLTLMLLSLIFFGYDILTILVAIPVSIFLIAIVFNLDVIYFIWKRERAIAVLSPFILFSRNIAGILGVIVGLIKFVFKKL